jgi:hypothetical protein
MKEKFILGKKEMYRSFGTREATKVMGCSPFVRSVTVLCCSEIL